MYDYLQTAEQLAGAAPADGLGFATLQKLGKRRAPPASSSKPQLPKKPRLMNLALTRDKKPSMALHDTDKDLAWDPIEEADGVDGGLASDRRLGSMCTDGAQRSPSLEDHP
ncbi:hypothetical protein EV714DRAFT_240613, partial [Schizophyllum commune]